VLFNLNVDILFNLSELHIFLFVLMMTMVGLYPSESLSYVREQF